MKHETLKVSTDNIVKAMENGYYDLNTEIKFMIPMDQPLDKHIIARVMVDAGGHSDVPRCVTTMQLTLSPVDYDFDQPDGNVAVGAGWDHIIKLDTNECVWVEFEIPGTFHGCLIKFEVELQEKGNDEDMNMDDSQPQPDPSVDDINIDCHNQVFRYDGSDWQAMFFQENHIGACIGASDKQKEQFEEGRIKKSQMGEYQSQMWTDTVRAPEVGDAWIKWGGQVVTYAGNGEWENDELLGRLIHTQAKNQAKRNITLGEIADMAKQALVDKYALSPEEMLNAPSVGDIYQNDENGKVSVYNGSEWIPYFETNKDGVEICNDGVEIFNTSSKGFEVVNSNTGGQFELADNQDPDQDTWLVANADGPLEIYHEPFHTLEICRTEENDMVRFFGQDEDGKQVETLAVNARTGEITFNENGTMEEKYRNAWISFMNAVKLFGGDPIEVDPPQPHGDSYKRAMGILK